MIERRAVARPLAWCARLCRFTLGRPARAPGATEEPLRPLSHEARHATAPLFGLLVL